jgi:hypothetical protein
MSGSWNPAEFPYLQESDHTKTSDSTIEYNCVAWAARDTQAWWWPDPYGIGYWPENIPRQVTIEAFIAAYEALGYEQCVTPDHDEGYEKIALYVNSKSEPTHAARQLPNGHWTSKLGAHEDIEHVNLECLNGDLYGCAVRFLRKRFVSPQTAM